MNSPDDYRVLCGLVEPIQAVNVPALPPFTRQAVDFLSDLSTMLLKNTEAREYPEIPAFAFFCRRANLEQMRRSYDDLDSRLGRGVVFHIAPGNVPMNFAYSLVSALLAGNVNIVKAPSKAFEQVAVTCAVMRHLLMGKHQKMTPYINVIEYPRERQDVTESFSAACNARIIWGGDETIRRVRQAALPPRAFDIAFADRWSLAVLDAAAVARMDDRAITELAKGFYNDTYLFDQNACTSPRLCVWVGEGGALAEAKAKFWDAVHAQASARYQLDPVTAVDKETELFRAAAMLDGIQKEQMKDNIVTRIHLGSLVPEIMEIQCSGGCFLEYDADDLSALRPVLTTKLQTIACAGFDPSEIRSFIHETGAKGADRAVRIGHTMDFSLIWDGYDLIRTLSRRLG